MITSSLSCCVQKKQKGEKIWNERLQDKWLSWLISMYVFKSWSSLMSPVKGLWWDEGGGLSRYLSGYHLPTCLACRAETQSPAGCRPEGGWMFLITQRPVSLCVCTVHLEAATRRGATSFLIPQLTFAPVFGNPHSKLVTAKSNILSELSWLARIACLMYIWNS